MFYTFNSLKSKKSFLVWYFLGIIYFFFTVCILNADDKILEQTQNKTNILVVSDRWETWTNDDSSGLVFDILKFIYDDTEYNIIIKYMSYDSSVNFVIEKKADIVVGVYENEIENVIFPKWHFEIDNISAVYKKNKNIAWRNLETIKNNKCGFMKGYKYDKYLPVKFEIIEEEDRKILLEKLKNDEIDFYLDAAVDIYKTFKKTEIDTALFTDIKLLKTLKVYFCFADNEKGKLLANIWDSKYKSILFSDKRNLINNIYLKWRKHFYPL